MSQKYFLERPMFFRGVSLIVGVLTMSVIISFAVLAAWTDAPANPPGNNVDKPLNIGLNDQIKSGGLSVGAFISKYGTILAKDSGNVGIGTASPSQKLEVDGKVLATDDVCNGAGACLSQIASFIASQPLVNFMHTRENCVAADGTVVDSDVGFPQCRFDATTCPIGWTTYKDYRTTLSASCGVPYDVCCAKLSNVCIQTGAGGCTTGNHNWANTGVESCSYVLEANCVSCGCQTAGCNAIITQVGCY